MRSPGERTFTYGGHEYQIRVYDDFVSVRRKGIGYRHDTAFRSAGCDSSSGVAESRHQGVRSSAASSPMAAPAMP